MKTFWSDVKIIWVVARSVWGLCRKHGPQMMGISVQPIMLQDLQKALMAQSALGQLGADDKSTLN